jgi:hypothetical protein
MEWEIEHSADSDGPWEQRGIATGSYWASAAESDLEASGDELPDGYYRTRPLGEERWYTYVWGDGGFQRIY